MITNDMLHTILRRRANGESVESIRPELIIPTGKRKGQNPSLVSIYRALADHEKAQSFPEAIEQAHVDFGALEPGTWPPEPPNSTSTTTQARPVRHAERPAKSW